VITHGFSRMIMHSENENFMTSAHAHDVPAVLYIVHAVLNSAGNVHEET
jgi:hypothetical protein